MTKHDQELDSVLGLMSDPHTEQFNLGRRAFLQAAAVGGAIAATPWYLKAKAAYAAPPIGPTDGVLVLINMYGGNDGMNTVVPYEQGKYYDLRKTLAVPADKVLPLSNGLGLHPKLPAMKSMWDQNKVAIVQGVGYPNNTLSHFDSMAIWMAGHASNTAVGTGWIGRYLDTLGPDPLRGVNLGRSTPPLVRGATTASTVLPLDIGNAFGADRRNAMVADSYEVVKAFADGPQNGALAGRYALNGKVATSTSATVQPLYTGLSRDFTVGDLQLAARLINADLGVRVITVATGNYDTHANQTADHERLLGWLNDGLATFFATLSPQFRARTTVMTFSEFGRRAALSGSDGTDHGGASCLFLMGDMVKGGLYGEYPSLTDLDRYGNLKYNVDFRKVYASVLSTWLKSDEVEVLGGNYGTLDLFRSTPLESAPGEDHGIPYFGGKNPGPGGYWLATSEGPVTAFGSAVHLGNPPYGTKVVGMASRPQLDGYWLTTGEGEVFAFGAAQKLGEMKGTPLNSPVVDIVTTASGKGYWLLGRDGGVFSFGDAAFYGSTGGMTLNAPVVGMASHPAGKGYWFVASDGGVFNYGPDAKFYGSTGNLRLNKPMAGMAPTPTGRGYWLVAADGGVFAFGDAPFHGSTGSLSLAQPIIGITSTPGGKGYWFVASDGGLFAFGDAPFHGSLAGRNATVVAMGG
ncbi:MAG: DUF1501 domain-containing protein [Acidimicrobiia bacterium]